MPIYEYACTCGRVFEAFILRKSDEAEVACPVCAGREVARQMSRPAAARVGGGSGDGGGRAAPSCGPIG